MRVWMLNHYALPPDLPGGTRHYELGRQLIERGYDVTILASGFHHAQRREIRLRHGESWQVEEVDGVKFTWLRTFPYQRNDWRRVLNMVSYFVRSYWLGRQLPRLDTRVLEPDIVIGSSVHLLAVLSAYLLARHFGAHFVMEVRDLWPQTLVDMGALSERHPLTRLMRSLERFLYRRAGRIIALLPKAEEYIAGLGIDASKIHWVPNGVSFSRFPIQELSHSPESPFMVMYVGAHGRVNALEILLDAARVVQNRGYSDIHFVFIGDGPEKARLISYRDQLGLVNIEFQEPIMKDEVPVALQKADVLFLVMRDLALYKYGMSLNKVFDYMAAGKPVILAGNPVNNVVEEAQCGLSVPPEEPETLADAIARLYEMAPGERRAMGQRGRAYVEQHHDWSVLAGRVADMLEQLDDEAA